MGLWVVTSRGQSTHCPPRDRSQIDLNSTLFLGFCHLKYKCSLSFQNLSYQPSLWKFKDLLQTRFFPLRITHHHCDLWFLSLNLRHSVNPATQQGCDAKCVTLPRVSFPGPVFFLSEVQLMYNIMLVSCVLHNDLMFTYIMG